MDDRGWQTLAWGVAAVVAVVLGARLLGSDPSSPPVRVGGADVSSKRKRAGGPATGPYVHVAGAVRRPGLYRLPAGARVAGAVRRAGGAAAGANLHGINLAARLEDGQQVVVPAATPGGASAQGPEVADAPVSLGSATVEQLDGLDGIGPTLARRIVEHRQSRGGFRSLDQLDEVEGIGEKRLEALENALTP